MSSPNNDIGGGAGPLILGALFDCVVLGLVTHQTYIYCVAFPLDRTLIKALAAVVCSLEVAQTAIVVLGAVRFFAENHSDLGNRRDEQLSLVCTFVMTGIVGCLVQTFFIYRIRVLSKSALICSVMLLVSLAQCTGALAVAARIARPESAVVLRDRAEVGRIVFAGLLLWLVGSAACDIAIATTMTIYLLKQKSAFRETQMLLSRLIALTIETGSLTAAAANVDVVLFLASPGTVYYIAPSLVTGKLYACTLLAVLNGRMRIRGGRNDVAMSSNGLHYLGSGAPQAEDARVTVLDFRTVEGAGAADDASVDVPANERSGKVSEWPA